MLEAKEQSGTWSLATHRRLSDALALFSGNEVEILIKMIIQRMSEEDASDREIFKLTQLCTMMHQKRLPRCTQMWEQNKDSLMKIKEKTKETPLGPAINRLVTSLYGITPVRRTVHSPSPPADIIGGVFRPTPVCITAKLQPHARTPVPRK